METQSEVLASKSFKFAWGLLFWLLWSAFGLLLAFPFKWCWNYAVTYVFHAPEIGWGHAYCLIVLIGFYKPSVIEREKR